MNVFFGAANPPAKMGVLDAAGQIAVFLAVFAVVLFLAYYATKMISSARFVRKGRNLEIVETRSLGAKTQNQLALVRAGEKVYLLGVNRSGVTLLSEIPAEQIAAEPSRENAAPPLASLIKFFKKGHSL